MGGEKNFFLVITILFDFWEKLNVAFFGDNVFCFGEQLY